MEAPGFYSIIFQNDTLFKVKEEELTAPMTSKSTPSGPIESPVAPPPAITPEVPEITMPLLQQSVLILTDKPLSDLETDLLNKILAAVGHSTLTADVFVKGEFDTRALVKAAGNAPTRFCIAFGVTLTGIKDDLQVQAYVPHQSGTVWFLPADPLSMVDQKIELKKLLWNALKQMFSR